ncbi:uncharacterized protein LOC130761140 [Actinidia eriantha]|uniref:uncharacterized protein LOC130761140 n=1 Tax=Actinidia eriantha TaxID=165200 RepID=UPI00258792F0|nr:uncharacterized protein LOC130761140 [Actinidia eriantha]
MSLKDTFEDQMGSSLCFFKNPLPWIVVLVFTGFLICGFLPIFFTTLFLIISSIFFTSSRHKSVKQQKEAQEGEVGRNDLVRSFDSFLESETTYQSSTTNEDSEMGQILDWSDDSISEEEGLIEIRFPISGGLEEEEPKSNLQQKFPEFSPEMIFRRRSPVEMLGESSEMNEEDNLIEIDISMGSIKCSRFENEA